MAYHTRRSGPQGMGRGTPPMMYQQQRSNNRASPNFGANRNTNSLQTPNNYQGNTSQTQSNNTNYAQQHQAQQQLQHPIQKPVQQQQQVPVKQDRTNEEPMQSSLSGALAPPPPPPPTLLDTNDSLDSVVKDEEPEENGEPKSKPWLKKKVPGFKVNKKLKRRRQNARLRKILQPKNAIMVLNELKTGIKFTFQEHTNALTQTMFVVNAEVDGKTYTGQGLSKPLAKQNAAENALKDLLLQKMADAAMKVICEGGDTPEPMNLETSSITGDNDSVDGTSEGGKPAAPEDEVPWGSLASFALYKLFTEWQNQGTHVPITKTPTGSPNQVSPAKPTAPAPMKKIPENPTERHPVMLLNQLRPGVEFKEVSREGLPPNLVFTLSVTIDGATYTGVAKNKKDAKKEAAKVALAGSFNIKYD